MVQKKSSTGMLAGIAFLAGAGILLFLALLNRLIMTGNYGIRMGTSPLTWLVFVAVLFLGVSLLLNKKSILPVVAGGLVTLLHLIILFAWQFSIWNLFLFLGWLLLTAVLAAGLLPQLKSMGESVKAFYYVPAILIGVVLLVSLIRVMGMDNSYMPPVYKIHNILCAIVRLAAYTAGAFFAAKWAFEEEVPVEFTRSTEGFQPAGAPAAGAPAVGAVPAEGEGYISMGKHVLLLLLTCGIWLLIWIHRTTAYTNRVQDEPPRDPTKKLLLCLFVPFYQIYWTYKTAQRVDKLSVEKGLPGDSATLMLILAILIGIVPPIMIQDKINKLASAPAGGVRTVPPQPYAPQPYAPQPVAAQPDSSAELRKFKQLLDEGVITQEEFEAKKKQLLGL